MKYFVFLLLLVAAYQATQSWMYNYTNGIEAQTIVDQYTPTLQFETKNYWDVDSKIREAQLDVYNSEANLHYLDIVLLCIAFGIIICWVEIIRNFWYDQMIIMVNIKTWIARRKNNKSALTEFKEIEAL